MSVRGIRGAITVELNEEGPILDATIELLNGIVEVNRFEPDDIASVFITVTQDLDATFPARAIRQMAGWELVPLMCSVEVLGQRQPGKMHSPDGAREYGSFPEGNPPRLPQQSSGSSPRSGS